MIALSRVAIGSGAHLRECRGGGADNPLCQDVCAGLDAAPVCIAFEFHLGDGNGVDDDLLKAIRNEVSGNLTEVADACLDEALCEGTGDGDRLGLGDRSAIQYEVCLALCT